MDIRRSEKIFRARCRKGGMRFGKMVGVVVYLYVRITPEGSLNLALSRRPPPAVPAATHAGKNSLSKGVLVMILEP